MNPTEIPPNETIYVQNLNEKISIAELKRQLFGVFSEYGSILKIHCCKTLERRGQAFIVFTDINSAKKAVTHAQGRIFQNKPMKVFFAKQKSDILLQHQGIFDPNIIIERRERRRNNKTEKQTDNNENLKKEPFII
eukprot:TRINITY_DN1360_c0_g1_i1.p1 TRINITY_DN1360_c0_g1~~TRINITY_DN1360_c0_g1_i1.p1  ORF type:complete len:136 (+),score=34.19 TRINITY_DN1360_c0_g1_i1:38-445(+)